MRWSALGLIALTLTGCGSKLKPEGPAIDSWERIRGWSENAPSRARYSGEPAIASPVVPVLAYGAHFDLGLVTRPKSEDWDQVEVGRLTTPDGPLWLALETREGNLEQVLLTQTDELDALMPELPLERRAAEIEVDDDSDNEVVKLDIRYENAAGEPVEIVVESAPPLSVEAERNVPVPGHSADALLALVDAGSQENAFSVAMKISGQTQTMEKEGGLVPYQYVGNRTHGGLAIGSYSVTPTQAFSFDSTLSEVVVRRPGEPAQPVVSKPDPLTVALSRGRDDLQGCYSISAKADASVAGQVLLSFSVEDGKADGFQVVNNSTADEALADCISDKVGAMTFPEEVSGPTAFPFVFEQGEGLVLALTGGDAPAHAPEAPEAVAETEPESEELPDDFSLDAPAPGVDDLAVDEDEPAEPAELSDGDPLDDGLDEGAPRTLTPQWATQLAAFRTSHQMASGNTVDLDWEVTRKGDRVFAVQRTDVRELTYEYLVRHDSLELLRVAVTQFGRAVPNTEISFSPALPDLRRPFSGRQQSRFVVDVGGQGNYAVGTAEAWWTDGGVRLKLDPEAPEWTAGRSMTTSIQYGDNQADVVVRRSE